MISQTPVWDFGGKPKNPKCVFVCVYPSLHCSQSASQENVVIGNSNRTRQVG